MSRFVPLISVDRVPFGKSVRVQASGLCFAVCNDNGTFHVIDCVCPHAGGPLGDADVRDGSVICPVHHWPWDLNTGLTDPNTPELRVQIYPCEVRHETVYADISKKPPRPEHDLDCHGR